MGVWRARTHTDASLGCCGGHSEIVLLNACAGRDTLAVEKWATKLTKPPPKKDGVLRFFLVDSPSKATQAGLQSEQEIFQN
eukprot:3746086-Amphidinium_carterae.1